MAELDTRWTLIVGEVRRQCPASCRKNRSHEPCACAAKAKVVTKVVIVARFEGVRRYRAWFSPNLKNPEALPRISNKDRFNEQGRFESTGVAIPDDLYQEMARKALGIINSGGEESL